MQGNWGRVASAVLVGGVLLACGSASPEARALRTAARAEQGEPVAGSPIATATLQFGVPLFDAVRAGSDGNLAISPASIVIALGLLEPGATGDALTQLHELLGIDDPEAFHQSISAFEQSLEAREDKQPFLARIANAAYLQDDFEFEQDYLDRIGTFYGPVLNTVDFVADPDGVRRTINDWVAQETNDRIVDLLAPGLLDANTLAVLVNALYLKALWDFPFYPEETESQPFTRFDGSTVAADLMHGDGDSSSTGDGWIGAVKVLSGGVAAQFFLPDDGRFDDVAARLDEVVAEYDTRRGVGNVLIVPRFELRADAELRPMLESMGLTDIFEPGNLLGVAPDPRLYLSNVVHQSFVKMDEEGTEAAAATADVLRGVGAPLSEHPTVPVILDRPSCSGSSTNRPAPRSSSARSSTRRRRPTRKVADGRPVPVPHRPEPG